MPGKITNPDGSTNEVESIGRGGNLLAVNADGSINADIVGTLTTPAGELLISTEPSALMGDFFNGGSLDTTTRWNTQVSGGSVIVSGGLAIISPTTTSGNYAALTSQPTFTPFGFSYLVFALAVLIEKPTVNGCLRFWGFGTVPGSPTVAAPITDGVGFQLDATGVLKGVVYASGVMIGSVVLPTPDFSKIHSYSVATNGAVTYFIIDYPAPACGTLYGVLPGNQTLPVTALAVNNATLGSSPTFAVTALAVGDAGCNNKTISDATYGWRRATVTANNALSVANGAAPFTSFANQSALNTVGSALDNGVARSNHTLFVMAGAGVSGGVVTLLGSNDGTNYVTTTCTVTTSAANTAFSAALTNFPYRYVLAKITTGVTGGTVTATVASC